MRKPFFILCLIVLTVSTLFAQNNVLLPSYGEQWKWGNIKVNGKLDSLYPNNTLKKVIVENSIIDSIQLQDAIENTIQFFEQTGYPFVAISFDSIQKNYSSHTIQAILKLELNARVQLDSLKIIGDKNISERYLINYLGLKPNSIYDERKIKDIQNRIDELTFLRLKNPVQVYFVNNKAKVVLNTEKRNANKFDGLIGIQPTNTNQRTTIIGQAQLYLINVLKKGEKLSVDFKSQANSTRDIKLYANYPYVFNSNFGVDVNIDLRRQDTTFSTFGRGIGIQYLFTGNNQIRFIYRVDESNLLSTKKYENVTVLPNNIDVKKYSYGINFQYEKLDYRINPKRGYSVQSTTLLGTRTILKNSSIEDSLYKDYDLSTKQILFMISFKKYFNIYKKNILLAAMQSKWIASEKLFNNELLRLGGINDLRGFDEEAIFASYVLQSTLEYRYILDRNSFFRLFYDQAYFKNELTQTEDYPYGIGLGVQMQTAAGMLQLNYALGSQAGSGLNFQTGKIHFGIINYF